MVGASSPSRPSCPQGRPIMVEHAPKKKPSSRQAFFMFVNLYSKAGSKLFFFLGYGTGSEPFWVVKN